MSKRESALFADLIAGSYLWAGVPADVFVTPQTTQQARRDKAKTREYRRRITVEGLAATQAQLWELDLTTRRQKELRENLVGRGRGMVRRADKYLAQQHGNSCPGPWVRCLPHPCSQRGLPCRMTISQPRSLRNLSMTLRRLIPKGLRKIQRKMMPP